MRSTTLCRKRIHSIWRAPFRYARNTFQFHCYLFMFSESDFAWINSERALSSLKHKQKSYKWHSISVCFDLIHFSHFRFLRAHFRIQVPSKISRLPSFVSCPRRLSPFAFFPPSTSLFFLPFASPYLRGINHTFLWNCDHFHYTYTKIEVYARNAFTSAQDSSECAQWMCCCICVLFERFQ